MKNLSKVISLICFLLVISHASFAQCHPDDYKALKAIYDRAHEHKWVLDFQDYAWNNESGWEVDNDEPTTDCDLSNWFGVTVNSAGRVAKLEMPNNRLFGQLPEELGLLTELEEIDLSNNGLSLDVPQSLKALTKLKKINFSQNGFIFGNWDLYGDMTQLEELYLQENDFQEGISDDYMRPLISLPKIKIIDLSRNVLQGQLWTDFSTLLSPSLERLDFSDNHISGCYKDEWRQLSNIVDLSKNHLCLDWEEFVEKGLPDLSNSNGEIYDKWWRPVGENPIILVDWEGHMSNPEIILNVVPPADMNYGMEITIEYEGSPMIYFMQEKWAFGTYSDQGFSGTYYPDYLKSIHMGIQPDRNFVDEKYELKITFNDGSTSRTIVKEVVVIDHDYDRPMEFDIEIDFSLEIFPEGEENLFTPGSPATIESEAALNDIAYFLADPKFDTQDAGTFCTDVLIEGEYGEEATYQEYCNNREFSDFYMVVTGFPFNEIASGGPVRESFAVKEGKEVNIPSMGIVQMGGVKLFTQDNHPEWYYNLEDDAWWKADIHLGGCPRGGECNISMIDYYGNMQHEAIHVMAMENRYPQLNEQVLNNLRVSSEIIRKYSGRPYIKAVDLSPHVGFRNTSSRIMNGRELTDRAYLGVMQAAGREIRETTSLMQVRVENLDLPDGLVGADYTGIITAAYGIPSYNYQVVGGNLPPGLILDSFTGQIHGTATLHGEYEFAIHIADQDVDNIYNPNGVTDTLSITIEAADLDNDGFFTYEDCDDNNPAINPDQSEIPYNGVDDDCNTNTPDDDLDGDGYAYADDCNDEDSNVNPSAEEIPYNGVDDDCNTNTPDDDLDGDGYASADDCNDEDNNVNPSAEEIPYNGVDDDCNTNTPDDDLDGDGYAYADDCNDEDSNVNPSAEEIPYNGVDDDCNADTADDDLDGDGFVLAEDCNDEDSTINPSAEEIPGNDVDENCDNSLELIASIETIGGQQVSVFPNPVHDELYVEPAQGGQFDFNIYDLSGRKIQNGKINGSQSIEVSTLRSGVYILEISSRKDSSAGKFNFIKK